MNDCVFAISFFTAKALKLLYKLDNYCIFGNTAWEMGNTLQVWLHCTCRGTINNLEEVCPFKEHECTTEYHKRPLSSVGPGNQQTNRDVMFVSHSQARSWTF